MPDQTMEFKGRVIMPGCLSGEAVVSREGFNILASFQKDAMMRKKIMKCSDQNNTDLFGRTLTGKILCLPQTIGSTTGGMVLQSVASRGCAPSAMLFSKAIDSLAAAGIVLADIWNGNRIVAIDNLGTEFLSCVQQGQKVDIFDDGRVIVHQS